MGRICAGEGCNRRSSYGIPGGKQTHCKQHALAGMENINSQKCIHPGCDKLGPSFGIPGERPTHCRKHALDGMQNIVKKRQCQHPEGCELEAGFGIPGGKRTRCSMHALDCMEYLSSRKCRHTGGCKRHPSFGFSRGNATHCKEHALDGMENVTSRTRCAHPDSCVRIPSFGLPGGKPTHCKQHALSQMENVSAKRCKHADLCGTIPNFGFPGGKPTHCGKHALDGMQNIVAKTCRHLGCHLQPNFGFPGGKATHCKQHALVQMEDVKSYRCTGEACKEHSVSVPRAGDLCYACRTGGPLKRWEATVQGWLEEWNFHYTSYNRRPDTTCDYAIKTTRQPDFLYAFDDYVVVLEVDEQYHRYYDTACEMPRIGEIKNALGGLPLVVVRFNPAHKRKDLLRKILTECFENGKAMATRNKYGILIVYIGYPDLQIALLADDPACCFAYEEVETYHKRCRVSHNNEDPHVEKRPRTENHEHPSSPCSDAVGTSEW